MKKEEHKSMSKKDKPHPMLHGHLGKDSQKWIQGAIKHKGALHKSLGVPQGTKIPVNKLKKAEHSKNPKTRKRAVLAETLRKLHK